MPNTEFQIDVWTVNAFNKRNLKNELIYIWYSFFERNFHIMYERVVCVDGFCGGASSWAHGHTMRPRFNATLFSYTK